MDTTKTITHIGLCAGYGGIEIGLKRVIPTMRTVALCEIEAFACANLVSKMEAGLLEPAPIWTDLKTFPWQEFRGRVDILTGGYPCQPFSAAGKRLGTEDPRHLWPFIASGIRILRPKLCFFENVEGHISLGLREVIGELEQMGYQVSWGIFSASEVGAPHQRKRVFIMAYDKSVGIQGCGAGWLQEPRPYAGQGISVRGGDAGCGEFANAMCNGSGESWLIRQGADGSILISNGEPRGTWPSRPGEPQNAWEPPRVVANANHKHGYGEERRGDSETHCVSSQYREEEHTKRKSGGTNAEAMGNSIRIHEHKSCTGKTEKHESWDASEAMGNTEHSGFAPKQVIRSNEASGDDWSTQEQEQTRQSSGADRPINVPSIQGRPDGSEQAMGNSKCLRISDSRKHRAMDETSGIPEDRERCESAQADPKSSASRKREGHWTNASKCGETQPALGGDADGASFGMDLSELSSLCDSELAEICEWMVKTDNRADELRLLGNGVVPATAERAFLTLWEEINK